MYRPQLALVKIIMIISLKTHSNFVTFHVRKTSKINSIYTFEILEDTIYQEEYTSGGITGFYSDGPLFRDSVLDQDLCDNSFLPSTSISIHQDSIEVLWDFLDHDYDMELQVNQILKECKSGNLDKGDYSNTLVMNAELVLLHHNLMLYPNDYESLYLATIDCDENAAIERKEILLQQLG